MLTIKESARQWAEYRKLLKELENNDENGFHVISVEDYPGVMLDTDTFLKLQKDSCSEVEFYSRGGSEYPLRVQLEFEGTIFYAILKSQDIKKFKEMGFKINVEGSDY
ncbi:MAG: hypothetical protein ACOCRO_11765 [Halanaerobiales bacterium]